MPAAVTCEISPIEDIEDLFTRAEEAPAVRTAGYSEVVPRLRKNKLGTKKSIGVDCEGTTEINGSEEAEDVRGSPVTSSVIPGTQTVYVKTWGCSHNNSDSEYMAGQLAAFGYKITEIKENADLWLLNSCTVKAPAEDHFRNEIKKGRSLNKHVVVAGCVPQGATRAEYIQGLSVIGVQQIDRVVEVVEETLKGHTVRLFGSKKQQGKKIGGARLDLPKIRRNPLIEIIAINTGCLNACTYCKTKHARGELGSYSIEEIVARAEQSFKEGVVEIWLTSEDTGAYGRDIGVTLPQLLWKLVEVIPEGARLRVGMTNPPYILEHLEEMSKILQHPRVYSFLHVPVQAGSDAVLGDMKREYCQADFCHVVDFLKERVPDVTIATDIICGFPTETAEDFEETLQLVEKYKFPSLFINQFFPRPGTPAAKMPKVPMQEVKRRTKAISKLFQSYHPYSHKLGARQRVLVTEVSHDSNFYVGHNQCYDQVLVPKDEELMGKLVDVDITETGKHFLKGKLASDKRPERPATVPPPLKAGQVSGVSEVRMRRSDSVYEMGERHPWWVQMAVIGLVLAVLIRITLLVFSYDR